MPLMNTQTAAKAVTLRPPTETQDEEMQARNALPLVKCGGALDSFSYGFRTMVFSGQATPEEIPAGCTVTIAEAFSTLEAWLQSTSAKTRAGDEATKSMVATLNKVWTDAQGRASKSSSPNFTYAVAHSTVEGLTK